MADRQSTLPGKKGACFVLRGKNAEANLAHLSEVQPYWNYGWCSETIAEQPKDIVFVPMVFCGAKCDQMMQDRIDGIQAQMDKGQAFSMLLAFNEPDKKEQSNMTVEKCLHYWKQLESLGVPLCSPSCANPLGCAKAEDACQGVAGSWMRDFMTKIEKEGLRCDYVGVHWYGGPNFKGFCHRMEKIHEAYDRPLILTEFAVADWKAMGKSPSDNCYKQSQVLEFMKQALPWLEAQPWIVGYAWFPFDATCPQGACSSLFTKQGRPTALGRYYTSITNENPVGNQAEKVWCD